MIESRFWRDELKADIRWLKAKRRYKRWSEKQMVLYERKLMLVAFQVRTLLERPKTKFALKSAKIDVTKYKRIGSKPYTNSGSGLLHERFDLSKPVPAQLSSWDVCNQLIHHYVLFATSERKGQFTSILVFSDYKRLECMFEIEIDSLIDFFSVFSDDSSAPDQLYSKWNEKKQDFKYFQPPEST